MKTLLVIIIVSVVMLSGCGMHTYGKMTCDGKCELIIDREIKELDPVPFDPVPALKNTK